MASGNGIEVAKAFVTIVPTMEGSQATISKELGAVAEPAAQDAGEKSGKKFGESLANGLKTTGAVIAGAMAAATGAAVATGKAFVDAANDVATMGDTIDKESQKMNMSATGYQEWDFILQHAGTSIEGMKTSMKKLTIAAEEGNEAFDALGISQEELASMSPEEIWNRTISSLQDVTDESTRLNLANSLLGKGSIELGALFNMTSEETESLRSQVHELNGVLSDEAVKDAAAYKDAMQNMNTALDGVKKNMMSNFLPGITSVMDGLAKVFSGDKNGIGQVKEGLQDVISNITSIAPEFFELAGEIVTSLLEGFAPMLPQIVETIFGVLVQAITTLTTMLPQMLPTIISGIQGIFQALFQALPIITESLFQVVMALVTWLSEGDNVTAFINGIIQLVTLIVNQISVILPVLLPAIVKIISEVAIALTDPNNIMLIIGAVIQIVVAVVQALIAAFPEIVNLVVGLLGNITEGLGMFVDWIKPFIDGALNFIVNLVTGWGNGIKEFISTMISNIWNGIQTWFTNLKNGFTNAFNLIRDKVSSIVEKVREMAEKLLGKLKELPEKVVEIGKNLITGLWNGISDKAQWCLDQLKRLGESIVNTVKSIFGVASPSKVFAEIGGFLAEGLGEGFDDEMKTVESDMVGDMENLTGNMTATVSAYGASGQAMGNITNYNGGGVTINVYGAEGQNTSDLAKKIASEFELMTRRKGAIYA